MYTRILVPVDGSPTSNRGLDEAIKLAHLTGAKLKLLHVVDLLTFAMSPEGGSALTAQTLDLLTEGGKAILADAKARARASGLEADTALINDLAARVCDQVVDTAKRWEADLIVIGTHGRRGVGRLMIGSDAEQIARRAPVPVLLVRANDQSHA